MNTTEIEMALWEIHKLMRGEVPVIAVCMIFIMVAVCCIYFQMRLHNNLLVKQNHILAEHNQLLKQSCPMSLERKP